MYKTIASTASLMGGLFIMTMLTACGGGGSNGAPASGTTSNSYIGTQSPGDVWNWTLGSGTFSGENVTLGRTYSGTSTPLPSGFTRLTITASTDVSIGTLPATAYALEVPGDILLIKPAAGGDLITGVARAGCPSPGLTYLGIIIPWDTWDVRFDKAYGRISSAAGTGGTYNFSGTNYYLNGTEKLPAMSASGFPCTDGVLSEPGTQGVIGVTPSGAIVGDFGPAAGGTYGIVQPSSPISTTTLASRTYRGMLFKRIGGVDTTELIGAEPGTGANVGRLVSFCFTNADTNTRCSDTGLLRLEAATQPNPGLLRFQFSDTTGTRDMVAVANQVAGRHVLYGIGVNGTNEPYNYILIEQ